MNSQIPFAEVLESVDQLSLEEQETLLEIVRRRLADRGRRRLVEEAQDARREFDAALCRPVTVEELMDEILS